MNIYETKVRNVMHQKKKSLSARSLFVGELIAASKVLLARLTFCIKYVLRKTV